MNLSTRYSADPVIQQQAIAIAESYLEEILLLPVTDPDGINIGETRATFDNISDYDGLINNGVIDQNGNTIAAVTNSLDILGNSLTQVTGSLQNLANYVVTIDVVDDVISGVSFKKVTVNVSRANVTVSLSGYRTMY
jgi:MSHA pilin protein MshD